MIGLGLFGNIGLKLDNNFDFQTLILIILRRSEHVCHGGIKNLDAAIGVDFEILNSQVVLRIFCHFNHLFFKIARDCLVELLPNPAL
jgi:hypothetical protein